MAASQNMAGNYFVWAKGLAGNGEIWKNELQSQVLCPDSGFGNSQI